MEEERSRRLEDHNKMLSAQRRIFSNQTQNQGLNQILSLEEIRTHYEKQLGDKVYLINELLRKIKDLNIELNIYKAIK